jgi:hypothetical protein
MDDDVAVVAVDVVQVMTVKGVFASFVYVDLGSSPALRLALKACPC